MIKKKNDETVESMIRRFKNETQKNEIMQELRRREYYRSPSLKRREKHKRALKRLVKEG